MRQYLFCDIDGTLLFDQPDGSYDIKNTDLDALRSLPQNEIQLVLSSGRACNVADFFKSRLNYEVDMIALNGAMILSEGKIQKLNGLPSSDYKTITEDIAKRFPDVSMGTLHFDGNYYLKEPILDDYYCRLSRHLVCDSSDALQNDDYLMKQSKNMLIPKILFYIKCTKDPNLVFCYLQETYGHLYNFIFSSEVMIECLPKNMSKAEGILHYMKINKISEADCFAVGDSDNDVEMLRLFPNSFCMQHGTQKAKLASNHIVENVREVIESMIK